MDILLVEDNYEIAELLQAFLQKEGFSLWHSSNSEDAFIWLKSNSVKIILLDIMLPGMDGFAFCQLVRQQFNIPILIVSARSSKDDQLMGFQLGADDYIEKPIDPDILTAKIKAVLLRTHNKDPQSIINSGELIMDVKSRQVTLHGKLLDLNVKEYELLYLFIQNPNKTLHKEFLFNEIWGSDSESEYQTLTVHIKMLRTKIELDSKHPVRIKTVWGIGYRYEEV